MTATTALDLAGRPVLTASGTATTYPAQIGPDAAAITVTNGEAHPAESLTPLPRTGEFVTTTDIAGARVEGYWLCLHSTDAQPRLRVSVLTGEHVKTHEFDRANVNACAIVQGAADADQKRALTALAAEIISHERTVISNEQWRESLIADMHEAADRNDLCGAFDEFCRDHGLPARMRFYELRVTATLSLTISREAGSAEEAIDDLDKASVVQAIHDSGLDYALDEWEAEEV